jgi:hypothetical protein
MEDFSIDVARIEELQTIKDFDALDAIFIKAKRTITGGKSVLLVRGSQDNKFDELTTDQQLNDYRETVYKYL